MRFVLASYGTRGDVEPCIAVSRELARRGHDVQVAVPPDLIGFAEAAGLAAVPYGPNSRVWQDKHREFLRCLSRSPWKLRELRRLYREDWNLLAQCWQETDATLISLANGADLLFTGVIGEQSAANVAEYYDIPLATLHTYPIRPNGQLIPFLPTGLSRSLVTVSEWLQAPLTKKLDDEQRRKLGLPKATGLSSRRITERGALEIQAYDQMCFPGLAAEWAKFDGQRPFVGALTVEFPTDADEEVASWVAAGAPPIFFGFGSMPVASPAQTLGAITAACAQLGERALVCAGGTDFGGVTNPDDVKVVGAMNYATVFPARRAVVHHGGAGTAAAGLRAGVPTLILSTWPDQTLWGVVVKRLQVGTARRFSALTPQTLVEDLRTILAPQYVARAREVANQVTKSADSVAVAADRIESCAGSRRVG